MPLLLMAMVVAGPLLVRVCVSRSACQCVVMSVGTSASQSLPLPLPPTSIPVTPVSKGTGRKSHRQQTSPPPQHASPGPWEGEGLEKSSPRSGGKGDSVGKGKKGPVRKMQGIPLKEDGALSEMFE